MYFRSTPNSPDTMPHKYGLHRTCSESYRIHSLNEPALYPLVPARLWADGTCRRLSRRLCSPPSGTGPVFDPVWSHRPFRRRVPGHGSFGFHAGRKEWNVKSFPVQLLDGISQKRHLPLVPSVRRSISSEITDSDSPTASRRSSIMEAVWGTELLEAVLQLMLVRATDPSRLPGHPKLLPAPAPYEGFLP